MLAQDLGLPYVSEQSEYSWLARDAEGELLPTCERLGLGFIPYFPLASGLLTGKVRRDRPPPRARGCTGREFDDDEARPRRALPRVGRGARRVAARRRDRRPGGGRAGRLGDRRRDEAGAGARERCRRRLGADARRARRAAGAQRAPTGSPSAAIPTRQAASKVSSGTSARNHSTSAAKSARLLRLERLPPLVAAHTCVPADRARVVPAHRRNQPSPCSAAAIVAGSFDGSASRSARW